MRPHPPERPSLLARALCGLFLGVLHWFALSDGRAQAGEGPGNPAEVVVEALNLRYGRPHPGLPEIGELAAVAVPLERRSDAAGVAIRVGGPQPLGALPGAGVRFDAAALRAVAEALVQHYNDRGIFGVWVAFEGVELGARGLLDRRRSGERGLSAVVWASQVAETRTLARGRRIPAHEAGNHPVHRWIREASPLPAPRAVGEPGSLFRRDRLERYLRALSAEPGRRVEASVSSAGEPGLIVLDYLVTEARPWQVSAQVSNTGTKATNEWRARVGFQHAQLTNHDDVLNIDVLGTPDFGSRAAFLSYRRPLLRPGRLTARVYGSFGDFTADGTAFENLRFVGDNWLAGAEITWRQDLGGTWDLAFGAGANYTVYAVATTVGDTAITEGESPFVVPFLSVSASRESEAWSVGAGVRAERSVEGVVDRDPVRGYGALGRIGADAEWTSVRWAVQARAYVEPWLRGRETSGPLAHEVALRLRGRVLPGGARLVPQEQDLLGGAFSVRGYPESVVSADETVLASLEYAFHIPRVLRPGRPGRILGRSFQWRPPQTRRSPDWDLVVRAFVDYAQRKVTPERDAAAPDPGVELPLAERDVDLLGAGVGVELDLRQGLSIRADLGRVFRGLKDDDRTVVETGDLRLHLAASLAW
jgi:hypothetical protein